MTPITSSFGNFKIGYENKWLIKGLRFHAVKENDLMKVRGLSGGSVMRYIKSCTWLKD